MFKVKFNKPARFYLGNFLITGSLLLFSFIYYPIIQIYLFPTPAPKSIPQGFYISIPKIGAYAPIIPNVDPWKESIYRPALEKGVAQAQGTALPGQDGTIYLFAHSSDLPWNITRYNVAFLRLGDLQNNDQIMLTYGGKKYRYLVTGKKEVWPTDVQYLKNSQGNQLILQTCTPVGTSFKRLLVFARPA